MYVDVSVTYFYAGGRLALALVLSFHYFQMPKIPQVFSNFLLIVWDDGVKDVGYYYIVINSLKLQQEYIFLVN